MSGNIAVADNQNLSYPKYSEECKTYAYPKVNTLRHENEYVNVESNALETTRSHVSKCSESSLYNPVYNDKSVRSKQCASVWNRTTDSASGSLKTSQKSTTNKDITNTYNPIHTSNYFSNEQTPNEPKGSILLQSKFTHIREAVPSKSNEQLISFEKQNLLHLKATNIQPNQVKTKLRSMWNNMKYGWRVKREVNLKVDSATWLLGQCYHNKLNDGTHLLQDVSKQLKLDLLSKIWLTYRINFPTIPGTEFVSDSGWGCMLRCGQMMMAQALVCHFLHRDWRISPDQPEGTRHLYKMILRWFGDSLSETSPFSLHCLVSLGENYGRKAGDWYGPTHAAQVLRDALFQCQTHHPQLKDVCMHVALDGIVFKEDIADICAGLPANNSHCSKTQQRATSAEIEHLFEDSAERRLFEENNLLHNIDNLHFESEQVHENCFDDTCPSYTEFGPPSFNTAQRSWKSLILFVSVRLGNDKINPFYIPCLKSLLAYEHCIGIIGGRPKHALYFIGWQDDKLIHMDPHSCQPAVDVERQDFNEKTFHSSSIRTISFTEMDPSCAIGFYFRKKEEFEHFVEKFSEITAPMKRNLDYPVFALAEGRRADVEEIDSCNAYTRSSFSNNASYTEDDDYILL